MPVGASNVTVKTPPDDVRMVSRIVLARWLRARPDRVVTEQINAIFSAARRSTTTWQPPIGTG